MKAKKVADFLLSKHIPVQSFDEGDEQQDGMVVLTPRIHVQVPTYGNRCMVVKEAPDECFEFSPEYPNLDTLLTAVRYSLQ